MVDTTPLKGKLAVLVPSCDKYADLWKPFFTLFWRFWPDCPFPVYLLTNRSTIDDTRVQVLPVGKDVSWSDNLAEALEKLNYEYVFLFLDDLFLVKCVDTAGVLSVLDWAVKYRVNYVRLNPSPKPDQPYNTLVGIVSPKTIYRTSTVVSVWKKEILQRMLRAGESAWDFEIKGSVRSDVFDSFFSTWQECFPVVNGVIKGKWLPRVVKTLGSLRVQVDTSKRTVMTRGQAAMFFCKEQRSRVLNILPPQYRRRVRDLVLRGRFY